MPAVPSLLWIVTTQWRAMATGYGGDVNARTPALDALASCSVNYRQAVTPHPLGPWARAALLTGVLSPANGVRDYYDPLPATQRTIAHQLAQRGYHTAFIGKWHLAPKDRTAPLVGEAHARQLVPPEYRGGFDFWAGFEGGFQLNDPWLQGAGRSEPEQRRGYQSDVLCARAQEWLATSGRDRSPWFLMVSLEAPHPPYDAAVPATAHRPAPMEIVLRDNVPRSDEVETRARRELAGYYAHISATDAAVGRLLHTAPSETVVVFTSVHGDMHGSHGHFRKGWPYEESVRVPLLVRGAPGGAAGGVNDEPVSLVDLPAMASQWAEGRAWRCPRDRAEISMPSIVALPHQCDRIWQGYRSAARKQIWSPEGQLWLDFDLIRDPWEQHNRAAATSPSVA